MIVKHKFNIIYKGDESHTMYTELLNGRYAKTNKIDKVIQTTFIDIQQYASALAHIMLASNIPNHRM